MENPNPTEKLLSGPTSKNLTGCFSPFQHNNQPWFMKLPGNDSYWVIAYSSIEKMEEGMADLGVPKDQYKVKHIDNGREFVESIVEHGIRVALDPYTIRHRNVTRWTEIVLEEAALPGYNEETRT